MKPTLDIKNFVDIATGELFQMVGIEVQNGGYPIDTSDSIARGYSPFVMYIEPPNVISPKQTRNNTSTSSTKIPPFASPLRRRSYLATNVNDLNGATLSSNPRNPIYPNDGLIKENNTTQAGLSDESIARDIIDQYKQLKDLPVFVFLINPNSMSMSINKVLQYSERTRFGYVFQAWGEELPDLDFQCKSGAYIAYGDPTKTATGLQFASMRDSAGFRQVLALLAMYRNGATIRDRIGRSEVIHEVGKFVIEYDGVQYKGTLESFEYGYDETQMNGGMDFSFKMKVHERNFFEPVKVPSNPEPKVKFENTPLNGPTTDNTTQPVGNGVLLPSANENSPNVDQILNLSNITGV